MFFCNNEVSEKLDDIRSSQRNAEATLMHLNKRIDTLIEKGEEDEDAPTLDTLSCAIARNSNKIDEILELLDGFKTVESMLSEGGTFDKFDERSRKVNQMLLEFKGLIAMARGCIRDK